MEKCSKENCMEEATTIFRGDMKPYCAGHAMLELGMFLHTADDLAKSAFGL